MLFFLEFRVVVAGFVEGLLGFKVFYTMGVWLFDFLDC